METAARESQQLNAPPNINKLTLTRRSKSVNNCWRCGKDTHSEMECWFKEKDCRCCGKKGHIERVCRMKKHEKGNAHSSKLRKKSVQYVEVNESSDDADTDTELALNVLTLKGETANIWVTPEIEGNPLKMELDTGAAVSLISKKMYVDKLSNFPLQHTNLVLKTYTGEAVLPSGKINVQVKLNGQMELLQLYVVEGDYPPLFGREWIKKMNLNWQEIKSLTQPSNLEAVLIKHSSVFRKELGTMKGIEAKIIVKPDSKPKFCQKRTVPYAIKPKVDAELTRLLENGVVSPVQFSDWATPIVPVIKKDGTVRLCGDFKVTVNPALCIEQYPIPRIEDLFASLAGGQCFSKLDLSNAYLQMTVEEQSRKYLTITTQKGLYCYNRLPFGIASAPALFQRAMDQILQGLSGVHCYLDDILVTGRNEIEHLNNLDAVLQHLEEYGLRVQKDKCEFFKQSLEYLGHIIDATGLHKSPGKVKAIVDAPAPENVSQLRSFLGLLNYYSRFIPNLATILSPLNALLCQGKQWQWTKDCEKSFKMAKEQLVSSEVLTHFDGNLPITLACDASPYGVGAVISHVLPGGEERPIAFASRTLSKAEQKYAQIEKEALGIVFGVRKFHQYLYGRKFTLFTDHRPLTTIFGPKKGIPSLAAARLQRWALLLSAHTYDIEYRKGSDIGNADGLSRLPLKVTHKDKPDTVDVFYCNQMEQLPVKCAEVRKETRTDPTLSQILEQVLKGGLEANPAVKTPFYARRHELSVYQGCLMWGIRVVIPAKLRSRVLDMLHEGHSGVVRMKAIARSYIWWPGIDTQIEEKAKSCTSCQRVQNMPSRAPLHPWVWPGRPWQRIHIDFAGPFNGQMFLIVVDAHSKWPEVFILESTTAAKTIQVLRGLFSHYGIPEQLVSDNGPQFISSEFEAFLKTNGVKHIRSTPYHPATNGLAERFVQTMKHALKSAKESATTSKKLDNFLLVYRNTPHATTDESPAMLFLKRKLRTRLDLLKPDMSLHVEKNQGLQIAQRQNSAKDRQFQVGQAVLAREYRKGDKWIPGVVTAKTGPVSYTVDVGPGMSWRRHADQLLDCVGTHLNEDPAAEILPTLTEPIEVYTACSPTANTTSKGVIEAETNAKEPLFPPSTNQDVHMAEPSPNAVERRYPVRSRKAPNHLTF
ncbi:uncharacterized protein K02A2.6-like [Acipenser ruthenus]|uniref:uncharacterized protein K02A2.6-like n=1 Tax=Acipenser ruthenus TaxID=7906 RepID=UPI0027418733|nr:uncharacterized protein K02A2.6-like [Acipenser ruthenus]